MIKWGQSLAVDPSLCVGQFTLSQFSYPRNLKIDPKHPGTVSKDCLHKRPAYCCWLWVTGSATHCTLKEGGSVTWDFRRELKWHKLICLPPLPPHYLPSLPPQRLHTSNYWTVFVFECVTLCCATFFGGEGKCCSMWINNFFTGCNT